MAIKDVVTVGFGDFSSVNKIPTRGLDALQQVVGVPLDGEITSQAALAGPVTVATSLAGTVHAEA